MGLEYSSVIDAPREELFAWHTRPGAFTRLSPPWQPTRIIAECGSVADGRAVLGLPGGLRWVADHEPQGYHPPARFTDHVSYDGRLDALPAKTFVRWRHIHDFEEVSETQTRMVDRVIGNVPAFALRSMFAYRHRQLAADIAAHQRAAAAGLPSTTVAITGASGLIGSALAAFLSTGGHRVIRLTRTPATSPDERQWNPADPHPDLLAGVDAVIHLAGASIAGRFTEEHRRAVWDSRVGPTRRLAELVAQTPGGPPTVVCASGIGYYGYDRGEESLTEDSDRGDGFLADLVAEWEAAAAPAAQAGARVVNLRIGSAQSPRGGALARLRPLGMAGLGGRIGDGRQWMAWIGIDDLVDVFHRALWDTDLSGPVNAVAPNPVRNADYSRALARTLRRPALLPTPDLAVRLALGEQGVREMAHASLRVTPAKLQSAGHRFRHPRIEQALAHVLGRTPTP
ncbi:TIGR01777 family oxidoreductase [Mycolicibacterium brumae]|uniref:TIGR01777 family protein n=1 Tax=Mycolicibacterium brumae TaxID=85968 RepID=A0A2G5P6K8_9MYCO|nr:TIGR01777 family oxidoreductase [Mycolicibacterium brumae]MCV7194281.1 TIGR01777 family protein [Mycolicibacterium brumae]PIB73906.1 TIGR01777 family protein [Mycolicibacterium brumae]RWA20287.1 hypothetical protein MBRU_15575 [Mycolicibacterium brumae DSM 44177]UWW09634.1 TIGR01777 family oxidoreductase [Mycolicibacterium brumae]